MLVLKTILYALTCTSLASAKSTYLRTIDRTVRKVASNANNLRGKNDGNELDCTLVLGETQFEDNKEEQRWECEVDSSSESSKRGHFLYLNLEFGVEYIDPEIGLIESGATTLHANDAIVTGSNAIFRGVPKLTQKPVEHIRRLSTLNERSVLVVRVSADDTTTSASEEDLAREVFGITYPNGGVDPNSFNLSNAYAQCSYDKLKFEPATTENNGINDGVYTVTINDVVEGQTFGYVRNVVLDQLRSDFSSNDLSETFDHVMICMPPGLVSNQGHMNWSAYAIVNGYVSVYNDNWCMSTSSQMHEIGHNIGLRHSNENGSVYEDKSGIMGHIYFTFDGPRMCFNPAKNWQLGWYDDRHATVNPLNDEFWQGQLIGYTDYMDPSAPSNASVVVKVEGHGVEYFIGFNVKTGINIGNQESDAINRITVHSVDTPGGESSLVAKLGAGESFEIANFAGGLYDALIHVENINMGASPPTAQVSVNLMICTSDSDCDDEDMCTTNTCNIPTGRCNHAPSALCLPGLLETELLTDKFPTETSWKIVDNCNSDAEIMSGSGYTSKYGTYTDSANLPASKYTLEIKDAYGDGICCGQGHGHFKMFYNDAEIYSGGKYSQGETYTWGSCMATNLSQPNAPSSNATSNPPSAKPSKAPSSAPSTKPSPNPTACEITYEIDYESSSSTSQIASWTLLYDENLSIAAKTSSQAYLSASTYSESGCLEVNCYHFSIQNAATYNLKINGVSVASSEQLVSDEMSLFGTCEY